MFSYVTRLVKLMKTSSWLKFFSGTFIKSSIRNKIVIPYALLTLLLAALGIFVVTRLVAGSFHERFTNQLIDAGRIVSGEIVNQEKLRLKVGRDIANTVGIAEALDKRDWKVLNDLVSPVVSTNLDVDSVIVVDEKGREVLRFYRKLTGTRTEVIPIVGSGVDLSKWSSVADVLADGTGKTKSVEIANDKESNGLIIYTTAPLRSSRAVGGVILVGNYLKNQIDLFKGLAAAEIILFDQTPAVLESTFNLTEKDKLKLIQTFTPERYREVVATSDNSTIFDDFSSDNTRTYRLAYAPFILQGRTYGIFAVALSTDFVTAANDLNRNSLASIFTIGVFVVMGIGWVVSQQIIKPLWRLVQISQAVAQGDLTQRTGLTGSDEVAELAATFDDMTVKLENKTIQLEEEASKLKAILSSIADGVIVKGLAGGVMIKNPAVEHILEVIGQDLATAAKQTNTTPPDTLVFLLDSLADLQFLEQRHVEMGKRVLSALSAPVVTSTNEQFGSVVILRDITQEVIAERLKDEFIQSVSHELKTPMFPLTGSISLVKMILPMVQAKLPENMYAKLIHNINVADEQSNDMKNVVMAMVSLSEINAGSFAIERSVMNLSETIELVTNEWFPEMEKKGLEFEVAVPDEPLWVNGDTEKLSQVLRSLMRNACSYTYEGRVDVVAQANNGRAEVVIKDTGVGILEEHRPYLFTRFFRAIHDKRTFELSGIGLGLYLSKVIIERHDGEISMDSKAYEGSTLMFALPIVNPEEVEAAAGDDDWDDWGDEEGEEPSA